MRISRIWNDVLLSLGELVSGWNTFSMKCSLSFSPRSEAQFSVNFYVALGSIELYETLGELMRFENLLQTETGGYLE